MNDQNANITSMLPTTNFFVYEGRKYPFNINVFNIFSKFFKSNKIEINQNISIDQIVEAFPGIKLTDKTIQDFLNYCQNKDISLNNENVFVLQSMADYFIVPSLKTAIDKYMLHNQDGMINDFLSKAQDNQISNKEQFEEIISNDLKKYIGNENLLSLPIESMYRILTKYKLKNDDINNTPKIIDFLFKCLDKYGKDASILFENINFHKNLGPCMLQLLFSDKYSQIFDFAIIRKPPLSSLMINESEDLKNECDKIKEQINDMSELISKLSKQIEELKQPQMKYSYYPDNFRNGIISKLQDKVKLSFGGRANPRYPITNILKYNNDFFINYFISNAESKDNWIEFDVGTSCKIDLSSYLIRTDDEDDPTFTHPKSWKITGSNDHKSWNLLDHRINDENLNGEYKKCHYECRYGQYGNPCNRYRYFRYIQIDAWCHHCNINPFNIDITYFELYGDIFRNDCI
ncbi:hypothetical protein M9Y10_010101 [Tritrichomonas musculus]|uniref:F5/8 type C domain-containing protein n=1 Tax=Tritrichomonas musculus TaxID=1915356 RepID=A0ABR2IRR5_9EUKA